MVRPWPDRPDRRLRPCQPTWLPTTWYLFAHSFFLHFCLFFVTCAISLPRPHLAFQSTLNSYRVLLAKVRWTQLFADASCDQFKHGFCERYSGSVIRCDPEQKKSVVPWSAGTDRKLHRFEFRRWMEMLQFIRVKLYNNHEPVVLVFM